ncbi:trypsin-like serine peptidase [Pedobacter alluvionis]|uniref:Serine protease n=1 Tax=Pedobacter alluvionis TaxID=475253 RepID=A0A497Y9M0_9SPHI|nr:serine protease [Pedobacter alluvionis]RLJ80223.1 trypsin-like peptidase [Pedobacter alluvionis]TFB31503.1 serine protease [Pedobacter alluvionis]
MNWKYSELAKTLSGLYYNQLKIVQLLIRASLAPGDYDLNESAYISIVLLLKKLDDQGLIKTLLTEVIKDYPKNDIILDVLEDKPIQNWHASVYAGVEPQINAEERDFNYEALTQNLSTLLPISFLAKGLIMAKSVVRIVTADKMGTGFLITASNILLTNNHVIPSAKSLSEIDIYFNYQKDINERTEPVEKMKLDHNFFHTSVADDWTIVKLSGNPIGSYGYIDLLSVDIRKNDFVNIIQHPGGEYKQISLYHNMVSYTDDSRIRYLTDTLPGSSGSPVFNSKWEVVALHNSGGYFPIRDGSKILCNQGININRVIDGIKDLI